MPDREWTPEEQDLIDATRSYYEAIAAVMQAGGDSEAAIKEAMPAEMRAALAELPMLGLLGMPGL